VGTLPGGDTPRPDAGVPQHEEQEVTTTLWPLTTGSTWTYRIDDPLWGTFEKQVVVRGPQTVPGTTDAAIAVQSTQQRSDGLEETSWQVVSDGIVFRVREEDRKAGYLVRVMSWAPSVMKGLASEQKAGWSHTATVVETERDGNGTVVDEKQKEFAWVIDEVGATITTAAGTWNNAVKLKRIRNDKEGWERVYWLVPGVGKVYETGERTEELISYEVKSAEE